MEIKKNGAKPNNQVYCLQELPWIWLLRSSILTHLFSMHPSSTPMFSEVQRKGALGTNRLTFALIVELNALTA